MCARAVLQSGEWAHSDAGIPEQAQPRPQPASHLCPDTHLAAGTASKPSTLGTRLAELELSATCRAIVVGSAGLGEVTALTLNSFIVSIVSVISLLRNDTA